MTNLSSRRKKYYFRSTHRGIKEMDILFGRFAQAVLADLPEAELDDYAALLELPDTDLLAWITRRAPVPEAVDSKLLQDFIAHARN